MYANVSKVEERSQKQVKVSIKRLQVSKTRTSLKSTQRSQKQIIIISIMSENYDKMSKSKNSVKIPLRSEHYDKIKFRERCHNRVKHSYLLKKCIPVPRPRASRLNLFHNHRKVCQPCVCVRYGQTCARVD